MTAFKNGDWAARRPEYKDTAAGTLGSTYSPVGGGTNWYPPVMVGAGAVGQMATGLATVTEAGMLLARLTEDDYSAYLQTFYLEGMRRFGPDWRYADIVTVLLSLARVLTPRRYLEIGVRRGRSVCAVASRAPAAELVLCDMWFENYAGMPNPGVEFVESELTRVGHIGRRKFINGDSHQTLPKYFADHPDAQFDLITIDGDHSPEGAAQDIIDVLPHLAVGGAIVFDDVCHPLHPELRELWDGLVGTDRRFSSWIYDEAGYGVAFAIRRW
jgi:predicted O-methyltransferase YrrM